MNSIRLPFVLLRARPDDLRGEQVNVGLVLFTLEGPRVYFEATMARLQALHPDFEALEPGRWVTELEQVLNMLGEREQQLLWLQGGLGSIRSDAALGWVEYESEADLHQIVNDLLERFVRMPHRTCAIQPQTQAAPRTKLQAQLRDWFRATKIFSPRVEDLSRHRVVPSFPIDATEDLYADFALKNGAVHIIEALDLRGVDRITKGLRGETGMVAVLLDQSRRVLTPQSRRIAVIASNDYAVVRPLVNLVARYADDVIAVESASDRQRLADFLAASLLLEQGLAPIDLDTSQSAQAA